MSLFLGLKEDLDLNLSAVKVRSSYRKYHVRRSFLPYSSNFNFTRSMLLAEGTSFRPLDNNCTRYIEFIMVPPFHGRKYWKLGHIEHHGGP